MPLEVMASIVVVGLLAVYVMMRAMKFDQTLALTDEAIARAEWGADNVTAPADVVILAQSGQAALVRSRRGWGVLWVMGLDATSHDLAGADVQAHPKGLLLKFRDFAAPSVVLHLTSEEATAWRAQIEEGQQ